MEDEKIVNADVISSLHRALSNFNEVVIVSLPVLVHIERSSQTRD